MPLEVGLLDEEGHDIRFRVVGLDVASVDEAKGFSVVLNLTRARQQFVFRGIERKPHRPCCAASRRRSN